MAESENKIQTVELQVLPDIYISAGNHSLHFLLWMCDISCHDYSDWPAQAKGHNVATQEMRVGDELYSAASSSYFLSSSLPLLLLSCPSSLLLDSLPLPLIISAH